MWQIEVRYEDQANTLEFETQEERDVVYWSLITLRESGLIPYFTTIIRIVPENEGE